MPADKPIEKKLRDMFTPIVPEAQRDLYRQSKLPSMDFLFFNGSSQGLAFPYLKGNEVIKTVNLNPEGSFNFQLPGENPDLSLDFGFGTQEPEVVLHTVMIMMDEMKVDMVWRAAVPYPGPEFLSELKKMEVSVA